MAIRTIMRRGCLAALAFAAFAAPALAQKTKLTVYTALENDQLEPFKKAFEADNPDHRDRLGARFDGRHRRPS